MDFFSTDETLYETSYLLARRRRYRYDVWCKMPGVPGKRTENPPEDWPTPGFVISDILRDWKDEMTETLKENHKSTKPFKLRQAFEIGSPRLVLPGRRPGRRWITWNFGGMKLMA